MSRDLLPFRLRVFHVEEGLGNACLLQLPDGTFAVIDWGTQSDEALETFFDAVDGPITFIAATHAHADHTLGLTVLIDACKARGVDIGRFVYPASSLNKEQAHLTRARMKARALGIRTSAVNVSDFEGPDGPPEPPYLAFGDGWRVRVLSPPSSVVSDAEERAVRGDVVAGNETSMVILFHFTSGEERRGLLTGDATAGTLSFARTVSGLFPDLTLRNDCFVVPHHGARGGIPPWLQESCEGAFVVSAPTESLHHPSPSMLAAAVRRCRGAGGEIFCTSYARACRHEYGRNTPAADRHLIEPGQCFGTITIDVHESGSAAWSLAGNSSRGELRRPYGYCGAHT